MADFKGDKSRVTKAEKTTRCGEEREISRVKGSGIREMTNPRGVVVGNDVVEKKRNDRGDFPADEQSR